MGLKARMIAAIISRVGASKLETQKLEAATSVAIYELGLFFYNISEEPWTHIN